MASFFKQLSDDMERVAQVVEEGAKFMMGDSPNMGGQGNDDAAGASASDPTIGGDDVHVLGEGDEDAIFDDMDGIPEEAYGSPLMGMADSVMSDIMSTQVRY